MQLPESVVAAGCVSGYFGPNCSLTCTDCPGECGPNGCVCPPGKTGPTCSLPCPTGTFGLDCNEVSYLHASLQDGPAARPLRYMGLVAVRTELFVVKLLRTIFVVVVVI